MSEQVSTERASFWKTFSVLVNSGVPILGALDAVSQGVDRELKNVISEFEESILKRHSLSEVMERHQEMFSGVETTMIAAGEQTGTLDVALKTLAEILRTPGANARANFWKNFGLLVSCGFRLSYILDVAPEGMDEEFRKVMSDVKDAVLGGVAFSDALAKHRETFSAFEVAMVRAGETAGNLNVIAERLAEALADMDFPVEKR